jgi:hypothetical protein
MAVLTGETTSFIDISIGFEKQSKQSNKSPKNPHASNLALRPLLHGNNHAAIVTGRVWQVIVHSARKWDFIGTPGIFRRGMKSLTDDDWKQIKEVYHDDLMCHMLNDLDRRKIFLEWIKDKLMCLEDRFDDCFRKLQFKY